MWDVKRRGRMVIKYGSYVNREYVVDYSTGSLGVIKGGEITEDVHEIRSIDVERDSDLIYPKKKCLG
ncbi:uncharacterized protein V1513DRAFT_145263 [Lipomyces chichibuensis]|uniref:uncharacterized protein n=1 Tax=Lipomyces chichibuensis TaxID=1546026 RepID=UPI003343D72A